MSANLRHDFTKDEMDLYLKELGKILKKENGKNAYFEIILVGGAAIACSYAFRQTTCDLDAMFMKPIKSAVNAIADRYNLPNDWLNADFMKTSSYSQNLRLYSKHYKTFSNVLEVRMISDEYLIAMKLRAFRRYKRDMSDVIGIVYEMKKQGKEVTIQTIETAFHKLYGFDSEIPEMGKKFLGIIIQNEDLSKLYQECLEEENKGREIILNVEQYMTETVLQKYLDDIIDTKMERDAFISMLEKMG